MRASGAPQAARQVKLLRQRKNIDGVAAAGHVGLGCHAELGSSHGASAGGDGDVLPAINRVGNGAANGLRRKTRLPNDLSRVGIERSQVMIQAAVEEQAAARRQQWRV